MATNSIYSLCILICLLKICRPLLLGRLDYALTKSKKCIHGWWYGQIIRSLTSFCWNKFIGFMQILKYSHTHSLTQKHNALNLRMKRKTFQNILFLGANKNATLLRKFISLHRSLDRSILLKRMQWTKGNYSTQPNIYQYQNWLVIRIDLKWK